VSVTFDNVRPLTLPEALKPCRCGCGHLASVYQRGWRAKGIHRGDPQFIAGPQGHIDAGRTERRCSKCGFTKARADFVRNRTQPDGMHNECKACMRTRHHEAFRKNPYRHLRQYGLDKDGYDTMLATQGGVCAICGCEPRRRKGQRDVLLHVDHDHATGKVRGLLCFNCNGGLGKFKDTPEHLIRAAEYLRRHGTGNSAA
jgi:hypothetical protein